MFHGPASTKSNATEQRDTSDQVNPFRSLGDAMKQWFDAYAEDVDKSDLPPIKQNEITDLDGNENFEFVGEDIDQSDAQILASATDDQQQQHSAQEPAERRVRPDTENPSENFKDEKSTFPVSKSAADGPDNVSEDMESPSVEIPVRNTDNASSDKPPQLRETSTSDFAFNAEKLPNADSGPGEEFDTRNIRQEIASRLENSPIGGYDESSGHELWMKYESLVVHLAGDLCEQLRLIMEPQLASKLAGDHRTGKRINMKRIIPYIASQFKNDRIWLRRSQPDKRNYQVMLCVDDSKSMRNYNCGIMAMEAVALIARAMNQLEVGEFSVVKFGGAYKDDEIPRESTAGVDMVHPFGIPFSADAGAKVVSSFQFKHENFMEDTPMLSLLRFISGILDGENGRSAGEGSTDVVQLIMILSDGHMHEREMLRKMLRNISTPQRMFCFVVLDVDENVSIVDSQSVSFSNGVPEMSPIMDTFPFPNYILLRDINALPGLMSDVLRQWWVTI